MTRLNFLLRAGLLHPPRKTNSGPATRCQVKRHVRGADHEQLAVCYEQEASTAKETADRHRRMLNDSYRPAYGSRYPKSYYDGFLRHCENLVRRYEEAAEDAMALAELHRRLAAEAKG